MTWYAAGAPHCTALLPPPLHSQLTRLLETREKVPQAFGSVWARNGNFPRMCKVCFVRTINSFSSSEAHNTATQVQSPWMTERAVTASKRTTPRHQSALQLAEHSTFYNVLTTTTSTSIKAHIKALSLA